MDFASTAIIQMGVAQISDGLGSVEHKARYLTQALSCDLIGCVGISEPDVGSNVVEIRTRAHEAAGGYIIAGSKLWISNGGYSDFCLCLARTGDAPGALDLFIVERGAGYASREIDKLGWRAGSTAELTFADVFVRADARMTHGGQGLRAIIKLFEASRPLVGLAGVGVGRAALEAAITYAKNRRQHGKPIAGHQLTQGRLAEMSTRIHAARLLCWRALAMIDRGVCAESEAAMAKWYGTETAAQVASDALQIHGAAGVAVEFGIEKLFRDARVTTIPEGTTEIQKLIIGRALTDIPAF